MGLNKLTEPDITVDVVNCNTPLYPETDGIMSNCSTLKTQGKPTVVTSQLQRDMEEHVKNNKTYSLPTEEKTSVDSQDDDQTEPEDENTTGMSQSEQEQCVEKLQSSGIEDSSESDHEQPQSEEADSRTEDDAAATEGQTENQDEIDAQSADEVSEKGESAVGQQRDQNVSVMSSRLEKEGSDSQTNDEDKDGERKQLDNLEYISQRAQCSESGLIMPITEIDGDLPDTTRAGKNESEK